LMRSSMSAASSPEAEEPIDETPTLTAKISIEDERRILDSQLRRFG